MNEYDYIINAFTKDGDNVNLEVDKLTVGCIASKNDNFSLDSDGNMVVKSITTKSGAKIDMDAIHPVGSIYISATETSPSVLFGGEWKQIEDVFLLACGKVHANGEKGGEENVELKAKNLPAGTVMSTSNGVNKSWCTGHWDNYENFGYPTQDIAETSLGHNNPHNNMPPYLAVYVWLRTA